MLHLGHAGRAARLLPAPTGSGSSRPGFATIRDRSFRATPTGGWPGCSWRRRSRPRSSGCCFNDVIETPFRAVGLVAVDAGRRRRHPVARRPLGAATRGIDGRDVPDRGRHRRRPGAGAGPGHQPLGHLDLGRPVRRARPRGRGAVRVPDGHPDHRRRRRCSRRASSSTGEARRRRADRAARRRAWSRRSSSGLVAIRFLLALPADPLARRLRGLPVRPAAVVLIVLLGWRAEARRWRS